MEKLKIVNDLINNVGFQFEIKKMHVDKGVRIIDACELLNPEKAINRNIVDIDKLRIEIIKWIKELEKSQGSDYCLTCRCKTTYEDKIGAHKEHEVLAGGFEDFESPQDHVIRFLKYFWGISDSDLVPSKDKIESDNNNTDKGTDGN